MSRSVLDSIALGYQPFWNPGRQLAAVHLRVLSLQPEGLDAQHLMQLLGQDWPAAAPTLLLSIESAGLRHQVLEDEPAHNTWLVCPAAEFDQAETRTRLAAALQRGHRLLREVELERLQAGWINPLDCRSLVHLDAPGSLALLQDLHRGRFLPVLMPGQAYAGVANHQLAVHCLDTAGAWGLLGWPEEDVLKARGTRPLACDIGVIDQIVQAVQEETSLEHLERLVRQDPVLVYRLLLLVNSAAFNSRREIGSIRHALMMLGFTALTDWLAEQRRSGEREADLHPVRYAMVMRSRLAQHLLASGSDDDLRAEVYLSALFVQLDRLLHRPLPELLGRLPLSGRVLDAALRHAGPYHPLLDLAQAQGDPDRLAELPRLCEEHGFALEDANRALIRMLATSRDHTGKRSQRLL
ncbi:MAG TPA: HDOD domain-containing protein [Hydrogenophaga sp.]|uniref:HDOD domain-containing protein n=1 Tax=Hydrogenophaga sp. TaxID=1904254 RepID=UPI002C92C8B7|nr:HDOD domain-containing protein [Hydrogenophaga sp.]HMN92501.1 HDOD domain-containing protein [Hydrogenophaga sp.]HMP10461.1 HDOD domain-containing protein [Hydrogenophaga sp.]